MNIKKPLLIAALLPLVACSGMKEQLGVARSAPDEFAVVKRAPLELPPDQALPKPQLGAPRPQEQETSAQAKEALFGTGETIDPETGEVIPAATPVEKETYAGFSEGTDIFLKKVGTQNADPNIRRKVDVETEKMSKENIPVARKLFGIGGDSKTAPATVVDAKAEAERLRSNKALGKPISTGVTPTVEK